MGIGHYKVFADLYHHVQAQINWNIISLLHIALIKILYTCTCEYCYINTCTKLYMYLLYLYQYYLNLTAFTPREVLYREITLNAKLQYYKFNRILEFMLILVQL